MSFQQSFQQSATGWICQLRQGKSDVAQQVLLEPFHGCLDGLARKRFGKLKIIRTYLEAELSKVPEP